MTPAIPHDEYQVVFLKDTKALTCYGCGSKVISYDLKDGLTDKYEILQN